MKSAIARWQISSGDCKDVQHLPARSRIADCGEVAGTPGVLRPSHVSGRVRDSHGLVSSLLHTSVGLSLTCVAVSILDPWAPQAVYAVRYVRQVWPRTPSAGLKRYRLVCLPRSYGTDPEAVACH